MAGNVYNAPGATVVEIHLTNNTEADKTTNLKTAQLGLCTDTHRLILKDDGGTVWRVPLMNAADDIAIPLSISHYGDTDTYLTFDSANNFGLFCGDVQMIDASGGSAVGTVTIGNGADYVDFDVFNATLFVDASAGRVGIGIATPLATLQVEGPIYADAPATDTVWTGSFSTGVATLVGDSGNWALRSGTAHDFNVDVYNGGTPFSALTILQSGKVGIGTPSPDAILSVNGVASFGAGAAALPSIAAFGDLNTGLWFPAADTLAASTGGVERMRVASGGEILLYGDVAATVGGISAKMQMGGAGTISSTMSITNWAYNASGPAINFAKSRGAGVGAFYVLSANDSLGNINFYADDGVDLAQMGASITSAVDGTCGSNDVPGRLMFSTTADGAASPTERMRITSAGLVGIGCTPGSGIYLDISIAGSPISRVLTSGADQQASHRVVANGGYLELGACGTTFGGTYQGTVSCNSLNYISSMGNASGLLIYQQDAKPISFGNNSLVRMVIDGAGLVGIGCTPAEAQLDINVIDASAGAPFYTDERAGIYLRASTTVAHGMTTIYPTSVFGAIDVQSKGSSTGGNRGGLMLTGMSAPPTGGGTGTNAALSLRAYAGFDPADATAVMTFESSKKNTTGIQALAATETAFLFSNYTTPLLTVLGDGKIKIVTPTEYADDAAAAAGGLAVGYLYRTGSVLKIRVA